MNAHLNLHFKMSKNTKQLIDDIPVLLGLVLFLAFSLFGCQQDEDCQQLQPTITQK